ncbi:PLP-dependent aminotransferase family protein [Paenibacillus nanensis]|uniref:PLP-dependent aminotransferase family protein n=2 Tax=Paenibacillus nanensis TaxID=393251 RepID=A0A3A1VHE6_9BACL|nr:PLP-dependent aminotransferase family protein [Paenibacillus nanensis]
MLSITPLLTKDSKMPIYMQLYLYIRKEIESGALATNQHLPSIRQLAQHLGVSKNTVEAAYGQLAAEGYVASRERGGYRVERLEEITPLLKPLEETAMPHTNAKPQKPDFDFRYGEIAFDRFPHAHWKACVVEALSMEPEQVLGYGDSLGHYGLREEIARYAYQSRGVVCHPDQILLSAGTQHAVSMLIQLLGLGSSGIAMEEPGYDGVKSVMRNSGCTILPIQVEADGIHVEQLHEAGAEAGVVYVTPSHQFPLGMVMPIQKRQKLLQWAVENERYIIEDDYDSEFRYNSAPIPALKALDTNDRVIYLGTLSKSFLPAARLSYIIMPASLLDGVHRKLELYSQAVSPIIQQAVWLFMKHGHFMRNVRRMRRVYQSRHRALTEAIREHFGERAETIGDRSGMHLLVNLKGCRSEDLIALAEQQGCKVYSPAKHWNNPSDCPPSYVMLGFGGLSEQQLWEGVRRLKEAWF